MPSTVLKGVTSRCPSPVSANALATASTRPSVLPWSPRTISAGPEVLCRVSWWREECLAGAAVAAKATRREKEAANKLKERADMNGLPDDMWGKDPAIMAESIALAATPFSFRAAFHRRRSRFDIGIGRHRLKREATRMSCPL